MVKTLLLFLAGMAVLRLQFLLFGDVVGVDPVFLAGYYAAIALPAPPCIWLAALMGLAGDWMVGYPLGLQGLALVCVAYMASRAGKYVFMASWAHFVLLTTGLYLIQVVVIHAAALLLRFHLVIPFRPLDLLTGAVTCLIGAAMAYRHEKRNRL
jgi:rod shape-determining protein MreD